MPPLSASRLKFTNIQALRGLAALLVCAFHYKYLIPIPEIKLLFENGWIGVQVFFMISGFIMVHTTKTIQDNSIQTAWKFMANRILRIVPLYVICTFIYIADDLNDGYLINHSYTLICSLLFISPFSNTIGPEYGMPSLEVGWSLNYEMFFYFIFALSLLFGTKRYYFLLVTLTTFAILIPFFTNGFVSNNYEDYHQYSIKYLNVFTNPILVHFIFGAGLGIIIPYIKLPVIASKILLIISAVCFVGYFTNLFQIPFTVINDVIFCGMLMLAILLNDFHVSGFRMPQSLHKLGDMSYSLYLIHPITIGYLPLIFNKLGLESLIHTIPFFILAIIGAIVAAKIFYELIEKRLTGKLKLYFNLGR